jgi:predicted aspartyl protease
MINGTGPFSLILDTGANHAAISFEVACSLGAQPDHFSQMIVHGVTGSTRVPTIKVDSISLGAFKTASMRLPIIAGAMDGADGFLSANCLAAGSIVIDLRRNIVALSNVRPYRAGSGYVTLRAELSSDRMLAIDARINGVLVKTVVDTGAGSTIGNLALQSAILGSHAGMSSDDKVIGATAARQISASYLLPPIALGSLWVCGARIACGDMPIFRKFGLSSVPAMIIGMDVLGQFDSLVVDFLNKQLHLRPKATS